VGPTDAPNKSEKRRMDQIVDMGCIASLLEGRPNTPCQIHHILSGGRRMGHSHTIGLTPWYHVGEPVQGLTKQRCREIYGPSLALEPKAFVQRYGTELELVELITELCEWLDRDPFRSGLMIRQAPVLSMYQRDRGMTSYVAISPKAKRWSRKSL
jgi:hypothetical protein